MELLNSLDGAALTVAGALLGLIVGSFLNVVIVRFPARLMHDWRCQCRELLGIDTDPSDAEVYQVDARTGKERRVRDVCVSGTPRAATQRSITFGQGIDVDNGFCSAESGTIPVSTIAPAMLVEELELQRSTTNFYKPPTLRFPPMR